MKEEFLRAYHWYELYNRVIDILVTESGPPQEPQDKRCPVEEIPIGTVVKGSPTSQRSVLVGFSPMGQAILLNSSGIEYLIGRSVTTKYLFVSVDQSLTPEQAWYVKKFIIGPITDKEYEEIFV